MKFYAKISFLSLTLFPVGEGESPVEKNLILKISRKPKACAFIIFAYLYTNHFGISEIYKNVIGVGSIFLYFPIQNGKGNVQTLTNARRGEGVTKRYNNERGIVTRPLRNDRNQSIGE